MTDISWNMDSEVNIVEDLPNFFDLLASYKQVYMASAEVFSSMKLSWQLITSEDIFSVFAESNQKKADLIAFCIKSEKKEEMCIFLDNEFKSLKWPEKRATWEIKAWIMNAEDYNIA